MNAPWKAGMAGNHEPFAAYICDEATLNVIREVAEDMGFAAERCHKGGLRGAIKGLAATSSPNILVIDLSESNDPINEVVALAEVCEPGTLVIAIGVVNDVRLYRSLISSGIHDYLLKPLNGAMLRDALISAQEVFSSPRNIDPEEAQKHITTAVIGTRGGVGASTIAASLAWYFSNEKKRSTALLDLDVHFGTAALTLDLEPGRGLTDALESPSRIDGLFIERAMIKANANLSILSAEAPINTPITTDGSAFVLLEEEFRQAFQMTVVDMPRDKFVHHPQLLQDVNVAVIVTEFTLASARDAIRILAQLQNSAAHVLPVFVANNVQNGVHEISPADFAASIEAKVEFQIPYDIRAAINAAKLGQTFIQANPTVKSSQIIQELGDFIIGDRKNEDAAAENGKKSIMNMAGLFARLGKKGE